MRSLPVLATMLASSLLAPSLAAAPAKEQATAAAKEQAAAKPWCAPEVTELSDHVCYADGGSPSNGRRTLVIYLHGALAMRHGFAYMQQRMMAQMATRHAFTVLMPTGPSDGVGFVWPAAQKDLEQKEAGILAGIRRARTELEKRVGHGFDETFVVGFSSGAYYASSLALRGAFDSDGTIVLAGATSWVQPRDMASKRTPIFVGVSAADPLSRDHSRALAGSLRVTGWPSRTEVRGAGHGVDPTFMDHGLAWLREQTKPGT